MDEEFVESIYTQVQENFEKSYQGIFSSLHYFLLFLAIAAMEAPAPQPVAQIPPERKLQFLKIVFEKLDGFLIEGCFSLDSNFRTQKNRNSSKISMER